MGGEASTSRGGEEPLPSGGVDFGTVGMAHGERAPVVLLTEHIIGHEQCRYKLIKDSVSIGKTI
jgi:hypothetical protein